MSATGSAKNGNGNDNDNIDADLGPKIDVNNLRTKKEIEMANEIDANAKDNGNADADAELYFGGAGAGARQAPVQYRQQLIRTIYTHSQIMRQISIPFNAVGKNLHQTIESIIKNMVENRCVAEGFVKPDSIQIKTYSSGKLEGDKVRFDVVFECDIFYPVAGMLLNCVAKLVNKAGITGESVDITPTPFEAHIMRDHFNMNPYFQSIKVGDRFVAKVLGTRFEINDKYVGVVAKLVRPARE